jgi:hypothetical protein
MQELEPDSFVLITGASQGLGRAFAELWASWGVDLILTALPESGLEATAAELASNHGVRVEAFATDLTGRRGPEALAAWVAERRLPVSVLINNAGVSYNARFEDSTLRENESCILLNNLALVKMTRLLLPELRKRPRAYVLNVASLAAYFPMPYQSVYGPTKTFILNFSLALREELRTSDIRVSVLCPSGMPTTAASARKLAVGGRIARITSSTPERVAQIGTRQMLAGKAVIIPGLLNQIIARLSRVAPRALVYAVMNRIYAKTARSPLGPAAEERT